jgi:hypothetical protein
MDNGPTIIMEVTINWWSYSSHGDVDTMVLHLTDGNILEVQDFIPLKWGSTYKLQLLPITSNKYQIINLEEISK